MENEEKKSPDQSSLASDIADMQASADCALASLAGDSKAESPGGSPDGTGEGAAPAEAHWPNDLASPEALAGKPDPKPYWGNDPWYDMGVEKAVWSAAFISNLPDSSFLYIEPGGKKDGEGKTTPRSMRHFPVKGPDGKIDAAHAQNAIGRIPQSNAPGLTPDKIKSLQNRARQMLAEANQ